MIGSPPVFSASEFVAVFNQSLEMIYPTVVIVGELAGFRISKGAWVYFDLKDESSSVKFFGSVRQLPGPLEDGMQLEVVGRPYLHARFGFSIQIMSLRPVGEGMIKKAQDLLATKLRSEGLFDETRKRGLPYPPERIALVTSAESAAYSDFIKIIRERWSSLAIELFDVQVQGRDAPAQTIWAIEKVNQSVEPFDVLVMVRGGGSVDDLAAFSTEGVVRAVAASRVPTLVAIGHERDISLAELAADKRASTPSNAAELLVPDRAHEIRQLKIIEKQLNGAMIVCYEILRKELVDLRAALESSLQAQFEGEYDRLHRQAEILRLLNPALPLARGFALVRNRQGQIVRRVKQVKSGEHVRIQVADGQIAAEVK